MKPLIQLKKITLIAFSSFILIACGGGGGIDGSGAPVENSASVSSGTISGFGSVIVNGVRYNTDDAQIFISGESATEADLEVGHYVTVLGEISEDNETGIAREIRFQPRIVGRISNINASADQFTILSQHVQITNSTIFDSAIMPDSIDGLTVNQTVRVSGLLESNNIIRATRIDLVNDVNDEIFGQITAINEEENQIEINNLVVDIESAAIEGDLVIGANVAVSGMFGDDDVLVASEVNVTEFSIGEIGDVDFAIIGGSISKLDSNTEFSVNGFPVILQPDTAFFGGSIEDIREDIFVEVIGLVSDGVLLVDVLEFLDINAGFIFGLIENLEIQQGTIPTATFELSGQPIETSVSTIFEDDSGQTVSGFNAASLNEGDPVIVEGNIEDGILEANYIERQESSSEFDQIELSGFAENITDEGFDLFSFSVVFSQDTVFILNGEPSTFQELMPFLGRPVAIEGILDDNIITATRVESEEQSMNAPPINNDLDTGETQLRGFASNITPDGFELFNNVIVFSSETVFRLNGEETTLLEIMPFLETDPVDVEGVVENDILTASLVSITEFGVIDIDNPILPDVPGIPQDIVPGESDIVGIASNVTDEGFVLSGNTIVITLETSFFINEAQQSTFADIIELLDTNPVRVVGVLEGEVFTARIIEVMVSSDVPGTPQDIEPGESDIGGSASNVTDEGFELMGNMVVFTLETSFFINDEQQSTFADIIELLETNPIRVVGIPVGEVFIARTIEVLGF